LLSCSHIVISILTFLHEIFELIKMMMMMMNLDHINPPSTSLAEGNFKPVVLLAYRNVYAGS